MKNNFIIIIFILGIAGLTGQNQASINASMKTAKMLERRDDIDGAIAVYKGVLLNSPNHHQSIRSLKSIYRNNQKYADGIQFLRERLARFPNDIKTYSELGEFHFLNDQKKEARSVWSAGSEKFKGNRSYYRIMVSLYGRYGLDEDLLFLLKKGRNKFGKSFLAYETGVYYQTRRVYDMAMDQFILHLFHEPKQNGLIERRILLMSDKKDALPVIETKLMIAAKRNPEKILNVLSEFYFKQQNYGRAFQIKMEWTALGGKDFNGWLVFADELRKEGQYQYSIKAYNFILGHTLHSNLVGKALLGLGQTFEDQIIPANEAYLIPYFFDNNIFFEDPFQVYTSISPEHLKSSLTLYDSLLVSLKKSPLLADTYFRLGEIQYRILQDFDQAYTLFHKALKNKPDKKLKLKIILRISDVMIAKGQSAEALGFLRRQMKRNPIPAIEQKKILVHFLTDDPDSTLKIVQSSFQTMSPVDPSFNDLMELKTILTKYYETDEQGKSAFHHYLKAEYYLRQKKIGDAIKELMYLTEEFPSAEIVPLAHLRLGLLHYRLKEYDQALQFALSLDGTDLADKGIILSGQIYESKLMDSEKAMDQYMRILDEFPTSIFSEPIRYHIRQIQQTES